MTRAGYGAMFLAGAMAALCGCGFAALPGLALLDAAKARGWERGTARLIEVTLKEGDGTADVRGRYEYEWRGTRYQDDTIDFATESSGRIHHRRYEALRAAHAAGQPVEAWVNPARPTEAVLFRDPDYGLLVFSGFGLFFALPGLGFLVLGLFGLLKGEGDARALYTGPSLPAIAVTGRDGGFELVDHADSWRGHGIIGAAALFWNALTWMFVVVIGVVIAQGEMEGAAAIFVPLFMVPFVAIGIGLGWWWLRSAGRTWRMPAGRLWLSAWPVRLGEPVQARFLRPLRGARGHEALDAMGGTLRLQEIVRHGSGTDVTTTTETVQDHALDLADARVDREGIHAAFAFTAPPEGPPSFHATSNRLSWKVRLLFRARGFPEDDSEFELLVLPGGPR